MEPAYQLLLLNERSIFYLALAFNCLQEDLSAAKLCLLQQDYVPPSKIPLQNFAGIA